MTRPLMKAYYDDIDQYMVEADDNIINCASIDPAVKAAPNIIEAYWYSH